MESRQVGRSDWGDLAHAVEAADRHRVPEDLAGELDLAAGPRSQEELARRAREEERGLRLGAGREPGQGVGDRGLRPREDLVGPGHGELDDRALRDGTEEANRPVLLVVHRRRPEVEAVRARLLEDRQRVGDRRPTGADVALVELEGGPAVDLEHPGIGRSRDRRPWTHSLPAGLDAERERNRAREQDDRQGVTGEDVAGELVAAPAVGFGGGIARCRPAAEDRDARAKGRPEGREDDARLHAADGRQHDAQPGREPRLGGRLRDRLPGRREAILGEVAPEPDDDVDRIRREQGEGHGVLAKAEHGGHLAGAGHPSELDPRVASAHLVDHGLVIDAPGAHQESGVRRRSREPRLALGKGDLERAGEVDVVAVTDGHPEHGTNDTSEPPFGRARSSDPPGPRRHH